MNGVIYCRVSSKEQTEGTSLESQELACKDFARSKNIKILKIFVERGESAKFADRTQLLELVDFCRQNKGKVNLLLVWKVDRFARNVGDHFNIKATLMKYGVRILSVTEPIDSNPEGKLMETILAGFAQFDNDIRGLRAVQGMRRKIQEGIFPWKPPLGYVSSTKNGEKKTEPDRPNQPLFGLLQKAWKEFANGAYTKAEIRRLMDSWGVLTEEGRLLSPQSVDNLFKNKYYAGILVDPWSGEEFEGRHIPMVSKEGFAQVQQVIDRRNNSVPHQKERPEFPLRGLVRCKHCLGYMTASFSCGRTRRYPYYHCHNKVCQNRGKSYPAEMLHGQFATFLDRIAPKAELAERLKALIVEIVDNRQEFAKSKKAHLESEVERLNRQLQELIRMRAQGLITDEEFVAQKSELSERRYTLEGAPVQASCSAAELQNQLTEIMAPLSRLRETWQTMPVSLQRRFQRLVLPAGFVNEGIRTAQLGLLFKVFDEFSDGESNGVPLVGKCWNRILHEIKAFWRIFRDYNRTKRLSKEAVLTNSQD